MILPFVGNVVQIDRHKNGGKMSILRVAHTNSGQTIEGGKYGQRETGYWDYQVFEDNLMAGSSKDFTKMMDAIKPGSTIEVLADMVYRTTKGEDGKTTRKDFVFTALRLSFVSTARKQDETGVQAQQTTPQQSQAAQEGFQDVAPEGEEDYNPDFGF